MWTIIGKWIGHWVVYFLLSAVVIWGLYAGLIRPITKPNPTSVQSGGTSYTIHQTFGCMRLPLPDEPKPVAKMKVTPVKK